MGFERVTSIIQGTKGFTDFTRQDLQLRDRHLPPDLRRARKAERQEIRQHLATTSGQRGRPGCRRRRLAFANFDSSVAEAVTPKESSSRRDAATSDRDGAHPDQIDIAFRVIADHIRTLSFAIADGIQPGNTDRNYVLRRILRRAVRYGRTLGFHEPFFYKLVDVLARTMGDVFPEIRAKQKHVEEVLQREEEAFNKTLDRGIEIFEQHLFGPFTPGTAPRETPP